MEFEVACIYLRLSSLMARSMVGGILLEKIPCLSPLPSSSDSMGKYQYLPKVVLPYGPLFGGGHPAGEDALLLTPLQKLRQYR